MKEGTILKSKDLYFEYIEDFADYIVDRVEDDEELFLTVVGKFDEIKNIIKEMFCIAEVDFESINIDSPIMNGYEDEYILDCWYDGDVIQIGCSPAKRNGEYIGMAGDETYIIDNCSSRIMPFCEGAEMYLVNIEDEDCCDECCDECCCCDCDDDKILVECSRDKDGNIKGFTVKNSDDNGYYEYSYHTNNALSMDDVFSML